MALKSRTVPGRRPSVSRIAFGMVTWPFSEIPTAHVNIQGAVANLPSVLALCETLLTEL
jgi:hypothetical protein